jgi:uncharacterized OB-fold protein
MDGKLIPEKHAMTDIPSRPDLESLNIISTSLVDVATDGHIRLLGGRCRACEDLSFPRAAVCTNCLSEDIETVDLPEQGTLYSYSIVHQAPKGWNVPYVLGYVDLPNTVRVFAHIDVPHADLTVDMKVKLSIGVVGTDAAGAPRSTYTFIAA